MSDEVLMSQVKTVYTALEQAEAQNDKLANRVEALTLANAGLEADRDRLQREVEAMRPWYDAAIAIRDYDSRATLGNLIMEHERNARRVVE